MDFLRPLIAAVGAVGIGFSVYRFGVLKMGENPYITLSSLAVTVVLYLLFACLTGAVQADDVLSMPMGDRLCRVMTRLRLLSPVKKEEDH